MYYASRSELKLGGKAQNPDVLGESNDIGVVLDTEDVFGNQIS